MTFLTKVLEEKTVPIELGYDDGDRYVGTGKTKSGGYHFTCIENPSVVAESRLVRALRQQEAEASAYLRKRRTELNSERFNAIKGV